MQNTFMIPPNFNLKELCDEICIFLQSKKMSTQCIQAEANKMVVQAKEQTSWKKNLFMDKAVTVSLSQIDYNLTVEIGEGKWMDKVAGAAVGWFLFWPTMVTSAVGTYQQMQLPKEINNFIMNYLSNYRADNNQSQNTLRFCSNCGKEILNLNSAYCENCGSKVNI